MHISFEWNEIKEVIVESTYGSDNNDYILDSSDDEEDFVIQRQLVRKENKLVVQNKKLRGAENEPTRSMKAGVTYSRIDIDMPPNNNYKLSYSVKAYCEKERLK